MKNASTYEKKVKKLLGKLKKPRAVAAPTGQDAVAVLIEAIFQADAPNSQAVDAMKMIQHEFVDFNELRVSPPKDISDRITKDDPNRRAKAVMVTSVLNHIFSRSYEVSIDYMAEMPKRELRRHLTELGLNPYAAALVVLKVFGGHAIPVDQDLVDVLKMDESIHPESDLADVQGFLERIFPQKDALAAHEALRAHVAKSAKALAKLRKAEADARAKAEAEAKAAAEAKAKAEAEAAAKAAAEAEARAKAKAEAEAAKAARKAEREAKKAAKKTAKKTAVKKAVKKTTAKKAAKKAAKKTVKKTTKKAVKKTAAKKTVKKKAAKKTAKKAKAVKK